MEVAIQYPLVNSVQMVSQPKIQSTTFTKHILRVDNSIDTPEHDYIQEEIYFTNSSIQDAIEQLKNNAANLDAVIINPEQLSVNITFLIDVARQTATPLI